MTEEEWLTSTNPRAMLSFLGDQPGPRKLWLFVCASLRRVAPDLPPACQELIAVAERFADGRAGGWELRAALAGAWGRPVWAEETDPTALAAGATLAAWARSAGEQVGQADLLRDLFGNPFRPPQLPPAVRAWGGGAAFRLAQALYEEERFADLPILADALEEAGCTDPTLLDHCRGPGPHARGCWALDAVLGQG